MSDELDLDGLHTQLESSPDDQESLNKLIAFYETEGAIDELMDLYFSQLDVQTEGRLILFTGLANVMRVHLEEIENAREVILTGLQEFPNSIELLKQLDLLSTSEETKSEYISVLKAAALESDQPALHALLNSHLNHLDGDEFTTYVQTLSKTALESEDAEYLMVLLEQMDTRGETEANIYLSELVTVALKLEDVPLINELIPYLEQLSEDAVKSLLNYLKTQAIENQNPLHIESLFSEIESTVPRLQASVTALVSDVAIALSNEALLSGLAEQTHHLNDIDFTLYVTKLESMCLDSKSLVLFESMAPHASDWSEDRQDDFEVRLNELTLKVSSPIDILRKLPELSTISESRAQDYSDEAKAELIRIADLSIVTELTAATDSIGVSQVGAILLGIFRNKADDLEITSLIQEWFLRHANGEMLDEFVENFARLSEDFDAVAVLMRARARRSVDLDEDESTRRGWQQRALSLNPSETGLHDYFDKPRKLDHQELNFLTNFVSEEQTEPRIGLRAILRALECDGQPDNRQEWLDILAFAYRRSQTFDADHQSAIAKLVENEATQLAADLLIESAGQESDLQIQRALFLDAGDHLLKSNPKESARCYYKAFETKNDDRVILGKLLDAYQKSEEWTKSIKVLKKLASLEEDPKMRAKYLYATGVIQRDKKSDHVSAVRSFDRALDQDPSMVKAIQAIDEVITNDQDYERQDRYYRKSLARVMKHGEDSRVIFQLAQNLATLNISKLQNDEAAIKALLVARAHATSVKEVDKQLLGLYRSNGNLEEALALHYSELEANPLKVRCYKELFVTLRSFGLNESSQCVDRTLSALGQPPQIATEQLRASRAKNIRHFGQHTWKMVKPNGFDDTLSEVFALLSSRIRATYALADDAYRFSRPEPLGPSTIPAVFTEVVSRLRVPLPSVWFSTESAPVSLVHRTVIALVLGPAIDKLSLVEQRFIASRTLMLTKPEYFLATHPSPLKERLEHLANLFNGCLQITKTGKLDKKVDPLVKRVLSALDSKEILSLTQIIGDSRVRTSEDVYNWMRMIDLMASRVAFVLTDNLEAAIRLTRELGETFTDIGVEDRLTDLLLFSVSTNYLITRGDLGNKLSNSLN